MKSLLLLPSLLFLLSAEAVSWRFVSKVEELPVEETDRLEVARPKVRLCGGDSEESTDCVLCTVCHPHEYELIGCSGQMDSVCASCTTGWLRSTPKTPDFFRKCKKHPQLPFLFPDIPYPVRHNAEPSSMFADQEKRLLNAENTETAEMDDELSEESDDYDGEDEEEEEEGGEIAREERQRFEGQTEEDQSKETGVKAVDVDEEDDEDSQELTPLQRVVKKKLLDDSVEESEEQELVIKNIEDDESDEEEKEIEVPGVFESNMEKVVEASEEDDDSAESTHRLYPLHKANIWRIIGPEMGRADDKGISKEERQVISDYKKAWWMSRLGRQVDDHKNIDTPEEGTKVIGGYRPVPVRVYYISRSDELANKYPCLALGWVLLSLIFVSALVVAIRKCALRRRNRFAVLPELDDMSRQLINEAHARVHGKTDKKTRPEFV